MPCNRNIGKVGSSYCRMQEQNEAQQKGRTGVTGSEPKAQVLVTGSEWYMPHPKVPVYWCKFLCNPREGKGRMPKTSKGKWIKKNKLKVSFGNQWSYRGSHQCDVRGRYSVLDRDVKNRLFLHFGISRLLLHEIILYLSPGRLALQKQMHLPIFINI